MGEVKKVLLWELDSPLTRDALVRLEQEQRIDIRTWVLSTPHKDDAFFQGREGCLNMADEWTKGLPISPLLFPSERLTKEIYKNLPMLLQNFARDTWFYRLPYYEYINVVNMLLSYFYTLLKQREIELIVWADIPHGDFGMTLYLLAEAMGIDSLILFSLSGELSGRVAYARTLEGLMTFSELPAYDAESGGEIQIKEGFQKDLPYMSKELVTKDLGKKSADQKLKAFLHPQLWAKERKDIYQRSFRRYRSADEFMLKKCLPKMSRRYKARSFRKDAQTAVAKDISLDCPFVYFPLHLQPEMTTDTLGGIYTDQLLAIEKLRNLLPPHVKIYVKENPKQLSYMREEYFFKRLQRIPETYYVSRDIDTYQLMEHALFVATITGTAGWEAISGGKPALIFGNAWYRTMPGVFLYRDDLGWNEITQKRIDAGEIKQKLLNIQRHTFKGILQEEALEYEKICISPCENLENVYAGLSFLMRQFAT